MTAPLAEIYSTTKKTYAPVACCIYCGSKSWSTDATRKLGDEHIVPEGVGGKLLLPEASCAACEKETSKFELELLRGSFYAVRVQKGLGKKKKRKPRHMQLKICSGAHIITKSLPIEQYPGLIVTLLFDTPEILLINAPPIEKQLSGGAAIGILPTFGSFLKEHLAQGNVSFEPPRPATSTELGRMLAKIGHSYAVGELGLHGFTPYLRNIILGTDLRYLAHFIGGTREIPPAIASTYQLSLVKISSSVGNTYLVVKIRLFADMEGMPEYWVVVGEEPTEPRFHLS